MSRADWEKKYGEPIKHYSDRLDLPYCDMSAFGGPECWCGAPAKHRSGLCDKHRDSAFYMRNFNHAIEEQGRVELGDPNLLPGHEIVADLQINVQELKLCEGERGKVRCYAFVDNVPYRGRGETLTEALQHLCNVLREHGAPVPGVH